MKTFSLIIGFLLSLGSIAQGWHVSLPNIPVQPSIFNRIAFAGYQVRTDSIYAMVAYDYGAANIRKDYIILHDGLGNRMDYFETPTLEVKDKSQLSRFLFSTGDLAYHTFYDYPRNEVIECVNLKTKTVQWSRSGYVLRDCISGSGSTYDDILCLAPNGDYEFIDKKTGLTKKTVRADSLEGLVGSFGQRDSIIEISRIAGSDSIQYFQGFIMDSIGSSSIVHAKYEKTCDCITADREIDRQWLWDLQFGFEAPLYTIYDKNVLPGDSTYNASIKTFDFGGDTIIDNNIAGPATLEQDGSWSIPHLVLTLNFDGSYMIESGIARNGFNQGRPEYQTGFRVLFFDQQKNLVNESEVFFAQYLSTKSSFSQLFGQRSFVLNADSSTVFAITIHRDQFSGIGFVGIDSEGFSPLEAIELPTEENTFHVYPNPFSDYFSISNDFNEKIIEVSVYNSKGQVVYENHQNQSGLINLADLPIGVYHLKILTETGGSIAKVYKK